MRKWNEYIITKLSNNPEEHLIIRSKSIPLRNPITRKLFEKFIGVSFSNNWGYIYYPVRVR